MRLRRSIIVALSSGLLLLGSTAAFADEGGCGEGGTGGGGGGGTVATVFGSGTYHAAGPGSFSDVAITLAASDTTPGVGLDGHGTFTIHEQPSNNGPTDLQGTAFCVNVTGNRGVVVGTITSSSPNNVNGRTVFIRITDNGQGLPSQPPDTAVFALSTLTPTQATAAGFCATNFGDQLPVTQGDFVVRSTTSGGGTGHGGHGDGH